MALTLFSMIFSTIFTAALQDCYAVLHIGHSFDGKVCNLRKVQAKYKVQALDVLYNIHYADDMAEI